ncbi:MAG: Uma2 family endonuclease [Verrucomicrobiales bacterium]|nr:Uma2 family endonuclease [Verrucomicrobiales bacterium]
MSITNQWDFVTVEDYLAGELTSSTKHEYRDGIVYAMAGARNVHNDIAVNAVASLHAQLRGRPCKPCNSDTKIRIRHRSGTRFYYPDVSVVCSPNPPEDSWQDAPVVILEVASPATRRIDLGEKMDSYFTIPTLSVYLVAETSEPVVRVYRRSPDGDFRPEWVIGPDAAIDLPAIGATLALADLYDGVTFVPESADEEEPG